jgi:hypothetical protein
LQDSDETKEKVGILKELQKLESKCSNHEEVIDLDLENAVNYTKIWASGGCKRKVRLQNLLFPKGLNYNKRNYSSNRKCKSSVPLDGLSTAENKPNKKRNTDIKYQVFRSVGIIA